MNRLEKYLVSLAYPDLDVSRATVVMTRPGTNSLVFPHPDNYKIDLNWFRIGYRHGDETLHIGKIKLGYDATHNVLAYQDGSAKSVRVTYLFD